MTRWHELGDYNLINSSDCTYAEYSAVNGFYSIRISDVEGIIPPIILSFENAYSFFTYCVDVDAKCGLPISEQAFSEIVELLEFSEFEKRSVCRRTKVRSILLSAIRGAIEEKDEDFLYFVKNNMLNIFSHFIDSTLYLEPPPYWEI